MEVHLSLTALASSSHDYRHNRIKNSTGKCSTSLSFWRPDLAAELEMTEEQVFASPMSQSKKRIVISSLYYTISQMILFIPNYFLAIVKLQQLHFLLQCKNYFAIFHDL